MRKTVNNAGCALVGAIRTDFGANAVLSPAIAAYDGTPAREILSRTASDRSAGEKSSTSPGDPAKMAKAIVDSVDCSPAPKLST